MGKASRKKHQQRLHKATLQKYDGVKLSDAILHLCEPFDTDSLDFNAHHRLITLAVTAWNIALSTSLDERQTKLLSAVDAIPAFNQRFEHDLTIFSISPTYIKTRPIQSLC